MLYMARYKDFLVAFRLPRELWERFKVMAGERGTSASRMLRATMEAELGRWETPARLRDRAKITEEEVRGE
jgi:predicted DNA-binding protein